MKQRESRFEILRIVSILFIVLSHFSLWEPWISHTLDVSDKMLVYFFQPLGQVGADLFILISAYFLANKHINFNDTMNKVKKIWSIVIFYSLLGIIFAAIIGVKLNYKEIIAAFFPVIMNEYWFVTAYIMLIIMSPVINIVVESLEKSSYKLVLAITIVMTNCLPLIGNSISGDKFSIVVTIYLIGGYLNKYPIYINNYVISSLLAGSLLLSYCSIYVLAQLDFSFSMIIHFTYGILPLISAVTIFVLFLNMKAFSNRTINSIAGTVFATYLITEHPLMRPIIWEELFNVTRFKVTIKTPLIGVMIVMMLFIGCYFIDVIRQKIFKIF